VDSIADVVSEAFLRIVGVPPARGHATTPDDVSDWDSLAQVQLVFEIEQALQIRMPEDTIVHRRTVGDLISAAEAAMKHT
jgi:acyl carrier protein